MPGQQNPQKIISKKFVKKANLQQEKGKDNERERDRQTQRGTERERQRESEIQSNREILIFGDCLVPAISTIIAVLGFMKCSLYVFN